MSTFLTMFIVIVVGARTRDSLRLRQQELVLSKLAQGDAVAYYEVLRRRVRNVRILRAVALASVVCLIYAWRHGLARVLPTG